MSSINDKKIFQWVKNNANKKFPSIDLARDSYFEDSNNDIKFIEEYDFKTIPEFIEKYSQHSTIEDINIGQICAIEAFSNKPRVTDAGVLQDENVEIPDFVYVF